MKALSFKQPWASLVIGGVPVLEPIPIHPEAHRVVWNGKVIIKDIENRNWATDFRGRIYVHASRRDDNFDNTIRFLCERIHIAPLIAVMAFSKGLPRGAIIGEVDIMDCVTESNSPWFIGKYGFVLANPTLYEKPLPCRGQLRFFEPDIQRRI